MTKDLFSRNPANYRQSRPTYPAELFEYILQFVPSREHAWDCATGNGQAAIALSRYFKQVDATDISPSQIQNAIPGDNITYSVCPAEKTAFNENMFDLVTVAQAYHWLDWKQFHKEVKRVVKPGGIIAIWVYGLLRGDDQELNNLVTDFYFNIVGPYWDKERKYVDEAYATVDFDFDLLPPAQFELKLEWTKEQLTGYLESWSAVQHYKDQNNASPLERIQIELDASFKNIVSKQFLFPIHLRLGRVFK